MVASEVAGVRCVYKAAHVAGKSNGGRGAKQMGGWSTVRLKCEGGGETGIRTLDTLRYTRFPSVRLKPLGHLSAVGEPL